MIHIISHRASSLSPIMQSEPPTPSVHLPNYHPSRPPRVLIATTSREKRPTRKVRTATKQAIRRMAHVPVGGDGREGSASKCGTDQVKPRQTKSLDVTPPIYPPLWLVVTTRQGNLTISMLQHQELKDELNIRPERGEGAWVKTVVTELAPTGPTPQTAMCWRHILTPGLRFPKLRISWCGVAFN